MVYKYLEEMSIDERWIDKIQAFPDQPCPGWHPPTGWLDSIPALPWQDSSENLYDTIWVVGQQIQFGGVLWEVEETWCTAVDGDAELYVWDVDWCQEQTGGSYLYYVRLYYHILMHARLIRVRGIWQGGSIAAKFLFPFLQRLLAQKSL